MTILACRESRDHTMWRIPMFRLLGLPHLDSPWPCKWTLARSFGTGSQTFPLHRHHLIFGACYVGNRLTQPDLTTGQSPLCDCIALSFLQISPSHHFPTRMSRSRMNPTVIDFVLTARSRFRPRCLTRLRPALVRSASPAPALPCISDSYLLLYAV